MYCLKARSTVNSKPPSLRNHRWPTTDVTRRRRNGKSFSFFHLFPIPMLPAPSLPTSPSKVFHEGRDAPTGPPKWHAVGPAAVARSSPRGRLPRPASPCGRRRTVLYCGERRGWLLYLLNSGRVASPLLVGSESFLARKSRS